MSALGHVPQPKKSSPVAVVLVALVSVGLAVGIGVLIFVLVRPRGERVGETSLMDPRASMVVDGAPGDSLFFRTDASVGLALISLLDDRQREREASDELRKSQLTVRATSPSGVERVATCSVYGGRATSTTVTTGTFSRSGMLNDCLIAIDTRGRWTVRASVVWSPKLSVRSATLETRREAAAH